MSPVAEDIVVRTIALTKTFRDFWLREKVTAVRDLDLKIRAGEVYGLLGPNGSGKSTTLKLLLGLMYPTRGQVRVLGKPASDVAVKARIGFLPEDSYLYPFLDARETLDYYGRLFHLPRLPRRNRIDMLLDMVGLTSMAHRRVGEYSKGMQRRIGMAQALINDPDLLILDEPTSGMDPLGARLFKDLIREMSRRGKTIILSSHLLADMEDVCDRVGILYAGQLRSEGTLDQMLSRDTLTQITAEHLDAAAVDRIRALLMAERKQLLAIETPKEKLEALFLRIIRQASARRGPAEVVETGQVARFLRARPDQEPRKVIQELMAPAQAEPPPPAGPAAGPAPAEPTEPPSRVIEQLMPQPEAPEAEAAPPPAEKKPTPPTKPPAADQEADRGVIDALIQKPEQETSDDA